MNDTLSKLPKIDPLAYMYGILRVNAPQPGEQTKLRTEHIHAALLLVDCYRSDPMVVEDILSYLKETNDPHNYTSWTVRGREFLHKLKLKVAVFIPDHGAKALPAGRKETYLEVLAAVGPGLNRVLVRFLFGEMLPEHVEKATNLDPGTFNTILRLALDRAAKYIQLRKGYMIKPLEPVRRISLAEKASGVPN